MRPSDHILFDHRYESFFGPWRVKGWLRYRPETNSHFAPENRSNPKSGIKRKPDGLPTIYFQVLLLLGNPWRGHFLRSFFSKRFKQKKTDTQYINRLIIHIAATKKYPLKQWSLLHQNVLKNRSQWRSTLYGKTNNGFPEYFWKIRQDEEWADQIELKKHGTIFLQETNIPMVAARLLKLLPIYLPILNKNIWANY